MEAEFNYNSRSVKIQCNTYDSIGQIFQKFSSKIGVDVNSLLFIYNGNSNINTNLMIEQVANFEDKARKKMNILVYNLSQSYVNSTSENIYLSNSQTITQYQNPIYQQELSSYNNYSEIYQNETSNDYLAVFNNNYQESYIYNNNLNLPFGSNINNIYNNSQEINNTNTGKPPIFQNFENLNKKYEQMEKDIKQKAENIKLKVEEMKKKLKNIYQNNIRYEDNKATYYGEVKQGKPNGLGIWIWDNGTKYEGEFFNSNFDGIGIQYPNDGIHMGEYRNGHANGFGIYNLKNGNKYEGDWIDDRGTGIGIITLENGLVYIGQTKECLFKGTGKIIYPNGDIFIGQVYEEGRDGITTYQREQGIFDAKFKYNNSSGQTIGIGIFYFLNGKTEKRKRIIKGREAKWELI